MSKKAKAADKGKTKAKNLGINKDTVQNLSDDELGKVQGGRIAQASFKICIPTLTQKLCPLK
jgi:hypothetical protein